MSQSDQPSNRQIALGIFEHGLLNLGEFTFKSGLKSPMYMNLRNLGSHPMFLKEIAKAFASQMQDYQFDLVGGIPYGAIPLMCAVSLEMNKPLIFPRKESKEYGMGKDIIGDFSAGQTVALVDDLVTDGASKVEALVPLESAELNVTDIFVLLDYDRGAAELLKDKGCTLHSIMTVRESIDHIHAAGRIDDAQYQRVTDFLHN